jgi:hypothetical protein
LHSADDWSALLRGGKINYLIHLKLQTRNEVTAIYRDNASAHVGAGI